MTHNGQAFKQVGKSALRLPMIELKLNNEQQIINSRLPHLLKCNARRRAGKLKKMSCIKNVRVKPKWYQSKYGNHEMQVVRVSKFMSSSTDFHVESRCKHCGLREVEKFVSWEECQFKGIPQEELEKIDDSWDNSYSYYAVR